MVMNAQLFRSRLWALRKTQRALARTCGIREARLSEALHGRAFLAPAEQQRLAEAIAVSTDLLFAPAAAESGHR